MPDVSAAFMPPSAFSASGDDRSSLRYVAVGLPLGYLGPTATVSDHPAFWVRRGAELVALSSLTFKIWALLQTPRTAAALASRLALPVADIAGDLLLLQRERLVVALPSDAQALLTWQAVRPLAQGVGAGASPEAPDWCDVMRDTRLAIRLSPTAYLFWAYSDGRRSLPEVVHLVADHLNLAIDTTLTRLELPALLEALLQSGALRLDATDDAGPPWA